MKLGINGLGRIGKLSLWHHVSRKHFSGMVVNIGREVGKNLDHLAAAIERDSSYGRLSSYLHGRVIEELNNETGTMHINGMPVTILRTARNPKNIGWQENDVRLVVDTTIGVFSDPTTDADAAKGALRGLLQAGAEKVILSAPFKIKSKGLEMPKDAVTTVIETISLNYHSIAKLSYASIVKVDKRSNPNISRKILASTPSFWFGFFLENKFP
jgi:glyceraldehyde 3-phosphate dehydrogenase